MSNPFDSVDLSAVAGSIIATIKERAADAWDQNEEARKFVQERAERVAKLLVKKGKLAVQGDPTESVDRDIDFVQQSIENELATMALAGSAAAKDAFYAAVRTAFGVASRLALSLL